MGSCQKDERIGHSRRILKALGRDLRWKLKACGAIVSEPEGAFYLFPDFSPLREQLRARDITTSEAFCERLLEETGVAVLPGTAFWRPPEELTVRIAYADFDGARALAAADQWLRHKNPDDYFLQTYCGNILMAIDRLCEWVHQ